MGVEGEIHTVKPGEAISGNRFYEPEPLKLTYEIERFGNKVELPIAAYCPFCRNEFTEDRNGRLVPNRGKTSKSDYCFDLTLHHDSDGEPFAKCGRCGTTTKQINPDPGADADHLHEISRATEAPEMLLQIEGALESFGSIIMPMDEFKRVGKALAKDPSIQALVVVDGRRLKVDWQTMRTQVKGFRRGTEEWPGISTRCWVPA